MPPTLVSFATRHRQGQQGGLPEFKKPDSPLSSSGPSIPETAAPDCHPEGHLQDRGADDRQRAGALPAPLGTAAWPRPCSRCAWATASASAVTPDTAHAPVRALLRQLIVLELARDPPPASCWAIPPRTTPCKRGEELITWPSCRRPGKQAGAGLPLPPRQARPCPITEQAAPQPLAPAAWQSPGSSSPCSPAPTASTIPPAPSPGRRRPGRSWSSAT